MVMYGSFFLLYRSTSRTIKEDYYDGGQSMINNRKRIIIISALGAAAVVAAVMCVVMTRRIRGGNPTGEALSQNVNPIESVSQTEEPTVYVDNTVDIIDVNSKTRPFAVSVNNTPVAVQVQTGLNKAYIVYELPTESYTCRLLALFKVEDSDVTDEAPQEIVGSGNVSQTDTVIGTIRSARHNFLDFCFESDAIFVHFGGSTYAESDEAKTGINWINGFYNSAYYWRRNPEGLATEHTAYTSLYRLKNAVQEKGFNAEAENASDTVLLNYDVSDVDLSKREDAISASSVHVPYSSYQYTTFTYDAESGNYLRFASGEPSLDHETGDLINKTVSVGASESGTEKNAEQILKMSGITDELINKVNMDYTEAAEKLKAGEIDAFFCTAGTRTEVIGQLSKECDIRLISLDDKCIDKMLSAYSLCEKYTIPAGTYNGQDSDVTTIGVKAVLIAKQSLSDDVIKNVTKTIYEHADDFKYATSLDISFDINTAADGVDIPFHSGAAAYYTERGINVLTE